MRLFLAPIFGDNLLCAYVGVFGLHTVAKIFTYAMASLELQAFFVLPGFWPLFFEWLILPSLYCFFF